jgi:hypothetical protein
MIRPIGCLDWICTWSLKFNLLNPLALSEKIIFLGKIANRDETQIRLWALHPLRITFIQLINQIKRMQQDCYGMCKAIEFYTKVVLEGTTNES